jgi:hypothetical protein
MVVHLLAVRSKSGGDSPPHELRQEMESFLAARFSR